MGIARESEQWVVVVAAGRRFLSHVAEECEIGGS